jgi:hypothetical protein
MNLERFKRFWKPSIYRTNKEGCHHCNSKSEVISIHHIIPIIELGNNKTCNLIPLCRTCHLKIHNSDEINLLIPLNLNKDLIKKKNKLLRKAYRDGETKFSELFIKKHLIIDDTMKECIRLDMLERLNVLIYEWKMKGLLIHLPLFYDNTNINANANSQTP